MVAKYFSSYKAFVSYIISHKLLFKTTNFLKKSLFVGCVIGLLGSCEKVPSFDTVLLNGTLYDGTGTPGVQGMIGIKSDSIAYIGPYISHKASKSIDATGKAISPGLINMLSWGYSSLLKDGRSLSDLKQGVTLEVFGEGTSAGPSGEKNTADYVSFEQAMKALEKSGVSTNIASYLGATTVRIQGLGYDNRAATPEELKEMEKIVEEAMKGGALGIGSSLIYAPGDYANTAELIALCKVAALYKGRYISHMRNEDNKVMEALEELISIARESGVPAEIYHLKTSRKANWHMLDTVIERVNEVRAEGLKITANMYPYHASSTGLTGVIPTWIQDGGHEAWINRMKDPKIRERLFVDIRKELSEQGPEGILMVGFDKEEMAKKYLGKTIAEAAEMRSQSPEETIVDLVIEDNSRIQCIYFSMSEQNIEKKIQIPWMSFCSDAGSYSDLTEDFRTHPRAFGSFARVLGKYSRDLQLLPLETAIHKLSGLPAKNIGIEKRGLLKKGYYADLVIFDPLTIGDKATFEDPLQFAKGVSYVFVNGQMVIENEQHTGIFPGRFVKGSMGNSSEIIQ
jgi:N-acyl-D-amino-acid deacylase